MKKLLGIVVLGLLLSSNAYALIYTKSGNIDPGLFIIWSLILLGVIWFIWSVTVDSIEINKNKAWMQKIKDEEFEKYKSYYERSKKKKKKKTKKY